MSDINDGGPAFPLADSCCEYGNTNRSQANGMTLRDAFAMKSLPVAMEIMRDDFNRDLGSEWRWNTPQREQMADLAYTLADAMLKAREAK